MMRNYVWTSLVFCRTDLHEAFSKSVRPTRTVADAASMAAFTARNLGIIAARHELACSSSSGLANDR